jgi:hypothetical protein
MATFVTFVFAVEDPHEGGLDSQDLPGSLYKSGSSGPHNAARDQNMGRTPLHAPEPKRRDPTQYLAPFQCRSTIAVWPLPLAVATISIRGCPQAGSATCWPLSTRRLSPLVRVSTFRGASDDL